MLLLIPALVCSGLFLLTCAVFSPDGGTFLQLLYELSSAVLPWLVVTALLRCRQGARGIRRMEGTRWLWMALYVLYIAGIWTVTGAGTLAEALQNGLCWGCNEVNLAPFSQGIDPIGYLLNVLLFVPLGFLTPLLWDSRDKFYAVLLGGFACSLLVEVSQLVNFRASDADDLVMNTLGAVVGWGLFRLFARLTHWKRERELVWPMGPAGTVALLFAGHFLLYLEAGTMI
ncbi:MAG: VanZ family protein [Clostridiales bacterium]|nr:VanZ family protein [Clostridiales bacterium]